MDNTAPEGEYWCFISYRHADNHEQDRNWASWLHQEIERYDVPAELVGTKNKRGDTIPERIYPVFRDEDSLPADADLANSIVNALDRSKFMVALCSPRSVESLYCTQEIHHFKQTGKGNRLIAAILAGEPGKEGAECFCRPLRHPVSEDGTLDTSVAEEPIAADFRIKKGREMREGFTSAEAYRLQLDQQGEKNKREIKSLAEAYESQLQLMKLKIIAGILGVPLEQLRDRDKAFQLEKTRNQQKETFRILIGIFLAVQFMVAAAPLVLHYMRSWFPGFAIEGEELSHLFDIGDMAISQMAMTLLGFQFLGSCIIITLSSFLLRRSMSVRHKWTSFTILVVSSLGFFFIIDQFGKETSNAATRIYEPSKKGTFVLNPKKQRRGDPPTEERQAPEITQLLEHYDEDGDFVIESDWTRKVFVPVFLPICIFFAAIMLFLIKGANSESS